jgi:hypothetical protein
MLTNESLKASGALRIVVTDKDGNIKEDREITNLVVTLGKNFVASRMVGVASNVMSHMAIGSGVTAAAIGDTALQTELGRVSLGSSTATTNVASYTATFPAGTGTGSITEAGILNASSAGTLLCRTVFGVVTKSATDALSISWNITIS